MSSDTNIWETGVNDNGNGTDNNQYFISDTSDTEKRLTIQRGTGNIGIGTNEPSQLLDVSGNINLSGNIYLSNTGTIYKNGQEYAGGSEGGEGGATVWQENGTKIHYNAGNVGINTSDPTETLEVVGNIKATSLEGTGTNITELDAGNITSGTISNAILPANISATNISATNISGDGSGITNLDATELTGIIDNNRLPTDISATNISATNISATNISGDGSGITNLDATQLTGIIDNNRLPTDISITGDLTAKNLNVTGSTTTIYTDTYQTENLEIVSTGADVPSLKITHNTTSSINIMQVTDTTGTQSLTMTHDGNIGIGTNNPLAPLHIYDTSDVLKVSNSEITINRSILPETNDSVDIGSAERKIRDMYISDNSLWIGDDHKLAVSSDGKMKFRKRKTSTLPKVLRDASGDDGAAVAYINSLHGTSYQYVTELKLNHVLSYARTINPEYKTSDIFGDETEDYDQDTAADAWQINNSKIYLGSGYTNIGIGTNDPDPNFKLHVDGNVHTDGTISADDITIKGSAETGSGAIKLNCETNFYGVTIKGPPNEYNQSYTLTLPSTAPEASKVLSTDASGNLSWIDPGSSSASASSIQNITTTASKVTIDTEMDVTNNVTIKGSGDTGSGSIKLNCEQNSHGVVIKGPPHEYNQSYTLTLPSTAPEASKVLSTDESGKLSWVEQTSGGDYYTKAEINSAGYLTSHQSLNNYYNKAEINSAGYLTSHQSLNNYYNKAEINSAGYLTSHQSLDDYYNKTEINDDYYNKTEINSAGYLTSHQSLDDYVNKSFIFNEAVVNTYVLDGSPQGPWSGSDKNGQIQSGVTPVYLKNDIIQFTNMYSQYRIRHHLILPDSTLIQIDDNESITLTQIGTYGWSFKDPAYTYEYFSSTEILIVINNITDELLPILTYGDNDVIEFMNSNIKLPPNNLLLGSVETLNFTANPNNYINGTQRNFEDDTVIAIDQPGWVGDNYITGTARLPFGYYTTHNFTSLQPNNILYAYEGDTVIIHDELDRLTTWENGASYCYLTLFYIRKDENVSYYKLRRYADISTNYAGQVGEYVIEGGQYMYQRYSNIKTTITYTLPSFIDPEYEFRFGYGKIHDLTNDNSDFRMWRIQTKSNNLFNNNFIEDLPIEKVKFQNTTGFLKITNGNLSYDTTVSYLEEKINLILEHLDLNVPND